MQALASPPLVSLSALQPQTGISRSTLHLLLDSLEKRYWIEYRSGRYIIGVRLFEIEWA